MCCIVQIRFEVVFKLNPSSSLAAGLGAFLKYNPRIFHEKYHSAQSEKIDLYQLS